jgi:hypothetical protein
MRLFVNTTLHYDHQTLHRKLGKNGEWTNAHRKLRKGELEETGTIPDDGEYLTAIDTWFMEVCDPALEAAGKAKEQAAQAILDKETLTRSLNHDMAIKKRSRERQGEVAQIIEGDPGEEEDFRLASLEGEEVMNLPGDDLPDSVSDRSWSVALIPRAPKRDRSTASNSAQATAASSVQAAPADTAAAAVERASVNLSNSPTNGLAQFETGLRSAMSSSQSSAVENSSALSAH